MKKMTLREASELTGKSMGALRLAAWEGRLRATKVETPFGDVYYVTQDALDTYLATRYHPERRRRAGKVLERRRAETHVGQPELTTMD